MSKEEPVCFVIMPISDQDSYGTGHFGRVYEYLIKPACIQAGFVPVRADEQSKTNYIVIDIIKRILESDMVICDLSAKNPNVLYELGIRQAFNKKAFLIKDTRTEKIFDIQGLRYTTYHEDLRIDSVQTKVAEIAKGLKETFEADAAEVNSLVQLLSINPAQLNETVKLSDDSSVILKAINSISDRLGYLENKIALKLVKSYKVVDENSAIFTSNKLDFKVGAQIYLDKTPLGKLVTVTAEGKVVIDTGDGKVRIISPDNPDYAKLDDLPF